MIEIFSIVVSVMLILAVCLASYYHNKYETLESQVDRIIAENNSAWEDGLDEQSEAYEMQILSQQERIDSLENVNRYLRAENRELNEVIASHVEKQLNDGA